MSELGFTQAPAEIEGKFTDPRGNVVSITLRHDSQNELVDDWLKLNQKLNSMEFKPLGAQKVDPPTQSTPRNGSAPVGEVETDTFEASRLVKSVVDGKTYWKVAGLDGKFPKFPVAIWPEVIERDLCAMDKLTKDTYPLDGYKAEFEKNDKGNPKKVIALVKP